MEGQRRHVRAEDDLGRARGAEERGERPLARRRRLRPTGGSSRRRRRGSRSSRGDSAPWPPGRAGGPGCRRGCRRRRSRWRGRGTGRGRPAGRAWADRRMLPREPAGGGRPGFGSRERSLFRPSGRRGVGWSSPASPRSVVTACGRTGATASRPSTAPRGEPGRLTMSVRPRTPATWRESIAAGSAARPAARIASASPGTSRSTTSRVASGVTSRGERPVPPVVRTRSAPLSASSRSAAASASRSSGRQDEATISTGARRRRTAAATAGPERSSRSPRNERSETVTTATRSRAVTRRSRSCSARGAGGGPSPCRRTSGAAPPSARPHGERGREDRRPRRPAGAAGGGRRPGVRRGNP